MLNKGGIKAKGLKKGKLSVARCNSWLLSKTLFELRDELLKAFDHDQRLIRIESALVLMKNENKPQFLLFCIFQAPFSSKHQDESSIGCKLREDSTWNHRIDQHSRMCDSACRDVYLNETVSNSEWKQSNQKLYYKETLKQYRVQSTNTSQNLYNLTFCRLILTNRMFCFDFLVPLILGVPLMVVSCADRLSTSHPITKPISRIF